MPAEAALRITAQMDSSGAQVEELKAKVLALQEANAGAAASARSAAQTMRAEFTEATHAVHLLGDEIGVTIPRHLRGVIAQFEGFRDILAASFNALAAIAFIEILDRGLDKVKELTRDLAGWGEAEQEINKADIEANKQLIDLANQRKQLERDIILARLSGSEKDTKALEFQNEDIGDKKGELRALQAELAKVKGRAQQPITFTDEFGQTKTELSEISTATQKEIGEIENRINILSKSIANAGLVAQRAGEDLARGFTEKIKESDQKFKDFQNSVLKPLIVPPADLTEVEKVQQQYDKVIVQTREFARQNVLLQKQADDDIVALNAEKLRRMSEASINATNQLNKVLTDAGKAQLSNFLAIPEAAVRGPIDILKELQKQISSTLEAERAQEQAIIAAGIAGSKDQIEVDQQLQKLRQQTAIDLRGQVEQFKQIAALTQDDTQIQQAKRYSAELDAMTLKTKTLATEFTKTFKGSFETTFQGLITGTQSVSQAFQSMAQSVVQQIGKIITQLITMWIWQKITGMFGGGGGSLIGGLGSSASGITATGGSGLHLPSVGLASGGDTRSGFPVLVGEQGPEVFIPSTNGTVVPNSSLRGSGGGPTVVYNVDARGADAGAALQIRRALQQIENRAVTRAKQSIKEEGLRR